MTTTNDQEKTSPNMTEINSAPDYEAVEALKAVKAGHADDVDIAAQILADNLGSGVAESWTPTEDKSLIRKVDWRLIPIVSERHHLETMSTNRRIALCLRYPFWS